MELQKFVARQKRKSSRVETSRAPILGKNVESNTTMNKATHWEGWKFFPTTHQFDLTNKLETVEKCGYLWKKSYEMNSDLDECIKMKVSFE